MKRSILALFSDPHGGSKYGLLNPQTVLYEHDQDGNLINDYRPPLTKIQEYIWDIFIKQVDYVEKFAAGDDVVVVANGDMTQGMKHPARLVSDRMADQVIIGVSNFLPWISIKPKAIKLIKGTGAHTFGFGSSELLIYDSLKKNLPDINVQFCDHALTTINGMSADIAHHGPPPGSRSWLKGNVARYYLQSLMLEEIAAGKIPPRLVARAHYHESCEETVIIKANGKRYKSTIVVTPSLCYLDDFAEQVGRSPARIEHGMFLFEILDGDLARVIPLTQSIDIRTKDEL